MYRIAICLLLSMSGLAMSAHAAVSVSSAGAANDNIPIETPPGVSAIGPKLSFKYNSQRGNGLLGMGWGLSGLSVIYRCPQTVAQDGVTGAVNFDVNDRFCLDGRRLVVVAGTYGAAGSEYRTEVDSFARIISTGTAGIGPASFTIESKDGKIMEYGVTADSRIEAQGKTDVIYWALNKVSDRQGNEVTFSYTENNATGHYRINRIDYAGNRVMATTAKASVRFVYESRTDKISGSVSGSQYSTPVRMTNVQSYITNSTGDVLVRDYRLSYEYGTASNNSRLLSIKEYDANGVYNHGALFTMRFSSTVLDHLVSIITKLGVGTAFSYKALTDATVYTKSVGIVDPVANLKVPIYVVSQVSSDNGIGGLHTTNYMYGGMKIDSSGRGNLGFAWKESTDALTGIVDRTDFRQDFPYVGHTAHTDRKLADGTFIGRTSNVWSNLYAAGSVYAPYLSSSVKESFEINDGTNNPITSVTTARSYNAVFSPTALPVTYQETVTTSFNDGHQRVAVSSMGNDMGNWIIGQLTQATVTNTQPNGVQSSRTSSFLYYPVGSGKDELLQAETIEPGSADPMVTLTTTYDYDGFGNRISSIVTGNSKDTTGVVASQSRTTTVAYDANGQFPTSTTNAAGHTETYLWDARFGVKTSLTGPNGLITTWVYDNRGRKVGENRADGTSTTVTYHMDVAPLYMTRQNTGSPAKTIYYDALGRKVKAQTTSFSGTQIDADSEYNALGQLFRKSAPYTIGGTPKWTTYSYDAIGRMASYSKPDGTVMGTTYNGLSTSVTNALNQTRTEVRDVHGHLYQVIDAVGSVLTYGYGPFGNLLTTTDSAGHVVSMAYDIRGRKISMDDPDMGVWSYGYNAFGELISQTNARGQTTTMTYDVLGRMTRRIEAEGASYWSYDAGRKAIGKLTFERAPSGYTKSYNYDPLGRLVHTTTYLVGTRYTMGTSYDANGRVSTITYPRGFSVQRIYNAQGYLSQVINARNPAEVFWTANTMDAEGRVLQETLGNGLSTIRQYNALNDRLEAIVTGTVQNMGFSYDTLGNLTSRSDYTMNWSEGFGYDTLNRLTSVTGPSNKSYAYDAIGNITNKSDVGDYSYDPTYPHAVHTAGSYTYTYDADGNMRTGAGRSFTWTSFDRPASISTAGAYVSMAYDANHRRIIKKDAVTGQVTSYIGDLFESSKVGNVTKLTNYVRVAGRLVATVGRTSTLVGYYYYSYPWWGHWFHSYRWWRPWVLRYATYIQFSPYTTKYMLTDQLGSISVITDANGGVLERLSFDAFGKPRNSDATDAIAPIISSQTTRGYTGHKMDAEVGLINMNARLYDPVIGRFISADVTIDTPSDMQTYNRFTYVMNNPFAHTDPSGNWSWHNFFKAAKPVVIVIVAVAVAYFAPPLGASVASGLGATGTAATVISGAVVGTAAGFAAGATGAGLYGGNLGDMWSAGLQAAGAGAIMGGVGGYYGNAWSLGRVGVTSVAGGFAAKSVGGSWNQGVKMAGAFAMVNYGYDRIVGFNPVWKGGDRAVGKKNMDPPLKGRINVGMVTKNVDPNAMWTEGGIVSLAANKIPGVNAVAGLHDQFQRGLQTAFGVGARNNILLNVGGMGIAAGVTYSGLVGNNPAFFALMVNANG